MKPGEKLILPIWFRTGVIVALTVTLFYSFTHRIVDRPEQQLVSEKQKTPMVLQKLHFIDGDAGSISVVDAENDREITRINKGEDGFMRSVMRGFVRERKAQGLGPEIPFELAMWEDGLVSLIDPATSRRVELSAFGVDNVQAFTRLLPVSEPSQTQSSASSS